MLSDLVSLSLLSTCHFHLNLICCCKFQTDDERPGARSFLQVFIKETKTEKMLDAFKLNQLPTNILEVTPLVWVDVRGQRCDRVFPDVAALSSVL